MKTSCLITFIFLFFTPILCLGQGTTQLATFNFTTHKCATPYLKPNYFDPKLWLSDYQLVNVHCASGTNYLTTNNWQDSNAALAFRIAPDDCKSILITKLRFQHKGSTSAGNARIELRSSNDQFKEVLGSWKLLVPGTLQTDSVMFPNGFILNDTTQFRWTVKGITSKTATYRQDNVLLVGNTQNKELIQQFRDMDMDGFGDSLHSITNCNLMAGYVLDFTDCDDNNDQIYPSAFDVSGNGVDENCDGLDGVLSLVENLAEIVEISPNPGTDYCKVRWSEFMGTNTYLIVTTLSSQVVYKQLITPESIELFIPTSDWTKGVYLLNLTGEQMNKQVIWIKI